MAKISINLSTGSIQQAEMIVGIDLGTTNSLIAAIHPSTKQAVALKEHDAKTLVPSIIHFNADGSYQVGDDAKPFLTLDPANTIFSIKRLLGKSYQDVEAEKTNVGYTIIDDSEDRMVKIKVGEKFFSPIELSSFLLLELKKRAEHILKTTVQKVVITVPAYFNDAQRQATRDAGKLAGLEVLRIINEPTAASLAYGLGQKQYQAKTIAVYDLGGGTFDISILRIDDGVFDVLSTNGNTNLGGDDFDNLIVNEFYNQIKNNISLPENIAKQQLRVVAQEAKKQISTQENFTTLFLENSIHISKHQFEEMASELLQKTIACCKLAVQDSGLQIEEIEEVILVGGSTRMPMVKNAVQHFFNATIIDTVNPDEVVALGAAWQADVLAGNSQNALLLDVTPLSLGIETMGGLMEVIVPRNSKIPTGAAKQYTTHIDGQANMSITVFQGERDMVVDNRKIASFTLQGIPAMPAGLAKVEIAFKINADGILTVSAKETRSGVQQSIEVLPQNGLTDAEVEAMLLASMQNAKQDMLARSLAEAKTEAEQIIFVTKNFIKKHEGIATNQEILDTENAIEILHQKIELADKDAIHAAIEKLNEISKPYAERLMDTAVANALTGKNIKQ